MNTGVRKIIVKEDDNGQRLDRWLKRYVPDMPYILAQKLLRKGEIRVNGKRVKTDTRLEAGQEVRIAPFQASQILDKKDEKISDKDVAYIQSLVIYDDGDVIAINKPPGLASQGGSGVYRHVDGLLDGLMGANGVRPRIVHRLDKDTSGVMLLARSIESARGLGHIFKGRDIRKIYWGLVCPAPEASEGTINAPLSKLGGPLRENMAVDEEEGKKAVTEFKVLEYAHKQAAFVAFWPRTGRMHQIRVHAALMGTPIIGDPKYGERKIEHEHQMIGLDGIDLYKGLHLHARRIMCPHPVKKGQRLDITAPLSPELTKSWKAFGFEVNAKGDPFAGLKK